MAVTPGSSPSLMDSLQSEVASEASPMLRFLVEHARVIAVCIALCILAIVGYWIYETRSASQLEAARRTLGEILVTAKPEERLKALESYAKDAPSSVRSAVTFAVAEAAHESKEYAKAYAAWEQLSKTDAGLKTTGTLGMAQALIDQGKPKEALALLDGISGSLSEADALNVNLRIMLLAESQGDYKRALAACDVILSNPAVAGDDAMWVQKKAALQQKLGEAK